MYDRSLFSLTKINIKSSGQRMNIHADKVYRQFWRKYTIKV